jgi:hypothetical protein
MYGLPLLAGTTIDGVVKESEELSVGMSFVSDGMSSRLTNVVMVGTSVVVVVIL